MLSFCRHKWEIITKTNAFPIDLEGTIFDEVKVTEKDFRKLLQGSTTVLIQCKICNRIRREEMIGNDNDIKK